MSLLRVTYDGFEAEIALGDHATVGRGPHAEVHLPDPMVGREHAVIEREPDGRFRIRDLGSRHGTFVSTRRVAEAFLAHGDEILIGPFRMRFEEAATPDLAQTEPTRRDAGAASAKSLVLEPTFPPASAYNGDGDALRRNYERLRAAFELSQAVGTEQDVGRLLERILDTAFQLLGTDRGAILIQDSDTGTFVHEVTRNRSGVQTPPTLSETIIAEVLDTRAAVLTSDAGADHRFERSQSINAQGIRSAMCVPLLHRDEVLGLMHLDSPIADAVFGEEDFDLFNAIAQQAAMAVKNAMLIEGERQAAVWDRLKRVVDSLPDGLIVLGGDRRIVLQNPPGRALLVKLSGAGPDEPVTEIGGLDVESVISWRCRKAHEITLPGPGRQVLSVTGTAIGSEGAESLLIVRDLTGLRDQEARARQQDQLALLGQLASGIAHDFNNLLAVILNTAELMAPRIDEPELARDLDQVRQAGLRAAALTRQLLSFSRRESIRPQVVDLNGLIAGLERLLELSVGRKITLESRLLAGALLVEADPTQLEQVVVNLVVNARDAMPEGGAITLATATVDLDEEAGRIAGDLPAGRYVELRVSDTGCGITTELRQRIFEPFFTTKEEGKGTGLGLAMVAGIIGRAKGGISVESRPAKGSTFRVLLPAGQAREVSTAESERSRTILLVEDDEGVRKSVARMLRQQGHTVIEAPSGETVMRQMAQLRVDLIIADVHLPGLTGTAMVGGLRAQGLHAPVLYISGEVDGAVMAGHRAREEGAFLAKPFTREQILALTERLLGFSRADTEGKPEDQRLA